MNDSLLLRSVLILAALRRQIFLILKRLINGLLLIAVRTYPPKLDLKLPLLRLISILSVLTRAELIGLPLALHPVGLVTILAVEAIRRVVAMAAAVADTVVLVVEINEALLGLVLDCAD